MKIGVGIVGGGQGCLDLIQLLEHFPLQEFKARVLGVADPAADAPGIKFARQRGIMAVSDFRELFSQPGIELIIELTGQDEVLAEIYKARPFGLKVIDHVGARLFWDLIKLKSDEIAQSILDSTHDAYIVVNEEGHVLHYNKAAEVMFPEESSHFRASPIKECLVKVFETPGLSIFDPGNESIVKLTAYPGRPAEFPAEVSCFHTEIDEKQCLVISIRDITERVETEKKLSRLQKAENLVNSLTARFALFPDTHQSFKYTLELIGQTMEAARVSLWRLDPDLPGEVSLQGFWTLSDQETAMQRGFDPCSLIPCLFSQAHRDDIIMVKNAGTLPDPDRTTLLQRGVQSLLGLTFSTTGQTRYILCLVTKRPRQWHEYELEILRTTVHVLQNALQREEAREALQESEALYQSMVNKSLTGIYIIQDSRFIFVNQRLAELFGYAAGEMIGRNPLEFAHPEDRPTAIRFLEAQLSGAMPTMHYTLRNIKKDGSVMWLECLGSRIHIKGKNSLIGNLQDVTEHIKHEQTLNAMFQATTMLAVNMAEQRDPYTAGHQRRVAELAVAIGRQLGMPEHDLEGLRLAGLLHDIGKVAIPIEILTKPGKLRPSEFQVIQLHSQVGAEILSEVPFPWDIPSIVIQHHERLDGSGYPRRLKGDEIIREARILAVADVAEAMSSHRPYRPALGMEAAIDEIVSNQGQLYDPLVVNAFLSVINAAAC